MARARVILRNMAQENVREWWEFWVPRWTISDEPLRNDARVLMEEMEEWEKHNS
jgi:hypothetical protein